MIGQQRLKDLFELLIKEHDFPRFTILCGPQGSGRKTMCEWIAVTMHKWMSINLYRLPDVKVDTIRQMITSAYQATRTTLYLIQDADTMSLAAKNALLKVTEEPPNNAYFVMTLEDANNTLDTVKSRGSIYWMDNYTSDEILEYAKRNQLTQDEIGIVKAICDVPGDVDNLCKQKPTDFYAYVVKAVDYIAEVEGANAFKLGDKIALKQDAEGYDLKLFFRAFMSICMERIEKDPLRYSPGISITSKYIRQLNIKGISKQMLFDAWILEIRQNWMR